MSRGGSEGHSMRFCRVWLAGCPSERRWAPRRPRRASPMGQAEPPPSRGGGIRANPAAPRHFTSPSVANFVQHQCLRTISAEDRGKFGSRSVVLRFSASSSSLVGVAVRWLRKLFDDARHPEDACKYPHLCNQLTYMLVNPGKSSIALPERGNFQIPGRARCGLEVLEGCVFLAMSNKFVLEEGCCYR